jgi:acyl-CoA thioester hydrolase
MNLRRTIRWRDVDALGHVNNAVYVTYLEEALIEALGPILGDHFVTARLELNFQQELRYTDGEVVVRTSLEHVGTSSLTFALELARRDGHIACVGRVVVVAWDSHKRASRALTRQEKRRIREQFETSL